MRENPIVIISRSFYKFTKNNNELTNVQRGNERSACACCPLPKYW